MGILEQQIKDIRQLMSDYDKGKIDSKKYNNKIKGFREISRNVNSMINVQALAIKARSQKPLTAMMKQNLIGNSSSIDLSIEEKENETVRCPNNGNLITRAQCLHTSGENIDACAGCNQDKITKNLLID